MSNPFKKIQAQSFTLAGAGSSIADQTIVLSSFNTIDGTPITMAMLGTKCFFTLEPGNGVQEEAGTFSGVTQNLNGTATLTGVKHQMFEDPYTETAGLNKSHAGGTSLILSNTAGFYGNFVDVVAPEAISTYTPTTDYQLTTKTWVENRNGYWEGAVANYAALTAIVTDADGAARVTLDDSKLYVWDLGTTTWNLAGAGGGAGTVYITTKLGTEAEGDDNKTFQLNSGSFPADKYLQVYKNGVLMGEGATNDYVATGSNQAVFNAVVLDDDIITLLVVSVDLYNPAWGSVNADVLPDVTATHSIGSALKKFTTAFFSGIVTALSFSGDGANLDDGANGKLTSGTTANKLVRLDGSAKLPAVDGSQLTGINNVLTFNPGIVYGITDVSTTGDFTISQDVTIVPKYFEAVINFDTAGQRWDSGSAAGAGLSTVYIKGKIGGGVVSVQTYRTGATINPNSAPIYSYTGYYTGSAIITPNYVLGTSANPNLVAVYGNPGYSSFVLSSITLTGTTMTFTFHRTFNTYTSNFFRYGVQNLLVY